MNKRLVRMLTALLLLVGSAVLLYPTISSLLAERNQSRAIQDYSAALEELDDSAVEEQRAKSRAYNAALTGQDLPDPFVPGSGVVLPGDYTSILNISGIMGYIEIPRLELRLPIRHGTGESALQKGVGHLEYSSLPVGGTGTHTVLTGHRALATAQLFTDLDRMEMGDVFYFQVLDETLAYQVDQILVVEPQETGALQPVNGKDYATLVTCTPYAVNSHRLLVRGERIPYDDEAAQRDPEEKSILDGVDWRIILIILFALLWLVGMPLLLVRRRRGGGGF